MTIDDLPPRIPRAEAVTPPRIRERMYDIARENERVMRDIEACQREMDGLLERNSNLVAEYDRLARKLNRYEDE